MNKQENKFIEGAVYTKGGNFYRLKEGVFVSLSGKERIPIEDVKEDEVVIQYKPLSESEKQDLNQSDTDEA